MNETITDATVFNAFKKATDKAVNDNVQKEIKKAVTKSKIHTGKLTRFYPWLNKAKVSVNGKSVICKILNRCTGNIVDLFTPIGTDEFDEDLKEPSVIPFDYLDCLVVDINSGDNEWLLLGYFLKGNLIATTPADKGDYKIARVDAVEEGQVWSMKQEQTYTKSEVDEIISKLKEEIAELKSQIEVEENDTTS